MSVPDPDARSQRGQGSSLAGWVFAVSYRPFSLAASVLAALAVPVWLIAYLTGIETVSGLSARDWHVREMLFGFLPAVVGGYLLSATPNWSGRLPVAGWRLAGVFGLWLVCRLPLDVSLQGDAAAALGLFALDLAFPATLAALLAREARVRAPRQTRLAVLAFAGLGVSGAVFSLCARLGVMLPGLPALPWVGISLALALIALVGGRLVPSLTRSTLGPGLKDQVAPVGGRVDHAAIGGLLIAGIVLAAGGSGRVPAVIVLSAAALQGLRLLRWRGWLLRSPEILALHVAYGWLVVALVFAGLSLLPDSGLVRDAGLHAGAAGAIGGMTMAVMGRLALSRSSIRRGRLERWQRGLFHLALALLHASVLLRVAAPLATGLFASAYAVSLIAAAMVWCLAWTSFAVAQALGHPRFQPTSCR